MNTAERSLYRPRTHQRGISLIELMVGLTVGLLLVAGLAVMFGNASRSSNELDKSVRHIENGRQAVDLLSQDLAMAGYYGTVPVTTAAAVSSPCVNSATLAAELQTMQAAVPPTIPFGVQGMTPVQAGAQALATPACMPDHRPGTPAVVVRRVETTPVAAGSAATGTLYLQSSHYSADNTSTYIASVNPADFVYRDLAGATNTVRRFISRIYYIANCSECANGGDGIPTLKLSELRSDGFNVRPLAEGIEQIGADYGFDTSGDGMPDEWYGLNGAASTAESDAAAAKGWANVVGVRIAVVSRTTEPTAGHSDARTYAAGLNAVAPFEYTPSAADSSFKRRGYANTVRLNTPAGLREMP